MAGASDKARFYLEQSVPELRELERKQLFTRDEITAIAKKRSEFEHVLNARGSHPSDYARYVTYEMNVEALRKKRSKRVGVKAGGHSGQRRIFFILERATRKFHGDVGLWMLYIEFARKEKARKKLQEVLTGALRMHPTKPELWIYAARWAVDDEADMTMARSYMQRGLRFCQKSRLLWLEYAKLEMIYVAKIAARRSILGLDQEPQAKAQQETPAGDDMAADMIALPAITAEDINPSLSTESASAGDTDDVALQNLAATPVLTGAIPRAVFDAAMAEFAHDAALGEQFFDLFAAFTLAPCTPALLLHVVSALLSAAPDAVPTLACHFRQPVFGVSVSSPAFPRALGESLARVKAALQAADVAARPLLAEKAVLFLLPLLRSERSERNEHSEERDEGEGEMDPALRKVVRASLRQYVRALEGEEQVAGVVDALKGAKRVADARALVALGAKQWPGSERLLQVQAALES
ncbi:uncharacterized protein K452DRAFT_328002 [Aplosporella prunicola CBS 121167]|uniref:U3 small nucleolar RNA-associated protein 6 N-terminal domain-containing protein n=1 Tax=Aplosporella prunicola CBS 121167 TaxID=1176127 RepID=A0A6A6B5Z2_9PEZI|nr:uncharacterized protein K452DRAFT_328002 [Aplosporella prunicola CBS 121167]KAF2139539.1 hypothetical protein K452DRAFT_328002 [Aplosporella prunicola CBS 121167]